MIPTARSLPDPRAPSAHLADRYDLGFTRCTLLRSLVNDVHELTTADARYVLKLYRHDGRDSGEIRWEKRLSAHPRAAGLRVPPVLSLPDGDSVGLLVTPEGPGPFVLSGFVEGTKPQPPFTDEMSVASGGQLAAFHEAATTIFRRTRGARQVSNIGSTDRSNRSCPSIARRKTCSATSRPQYGTTSRSTRMQVSAMVT